MAIWYPERLAYFSIGWLIDKTVVLASKISLNFHKWPFGNCHAPIGGLLNGREKHLWILPWIWYAIHIKQPIQTRQTFNSCTDTAAVLTLYRTLCIARDIGDCQGHRKVKAWPRPSRHLTNCPRTLAPIKSCCAQWQIFTTATVSQATEWHWEYWSGELTEKRSRRRLGGLCCRKPAAQLNCILCFWFLDTYCAWISVGKQFVLAIKMAANQVTVSAVWVA